MSTEDYIIWLDIVHAWAGQGLLDHRVAQNEELLLRFYFIYKAEEFLILSSRTVCC